MIRERGEPAILDTSKPILEAPVFPDYPQNTQQSRPVAEDPDLAGNEDEDEEYVDVDEDEDLTDEDGTVADEFDDDIENREVVIEDGDEIIPLDEDDEDDEF
ncbi:hypothetical protein [Dyadobacter sp. Leaf189]|uniref:hypothetical protein n=1 Tax=Dyadobacter sp. Leaf189 TaxID=1736295 RepID=UPI0006F69E27|nr:hypothetical protein [Dyadobacter sp. Leaf189]KQS31059.1 hypothetical protein ASG33_11920 [Dyadobacter sp. Leaf189]